VKTSVLLASLILAAIPGSAWAQTYDQPLPMTGSTPANAARVDPTPTPVPWDIDGSVKNTESSLQIEVSTSNALGSDGSLDPAYVTDIFPLYENLGATGSYTGQSVGGVGQWQNKPGTYYWMAIARFSQNPDDDNSPTRYYRSKVFTIQVGGPAVPAPTELPAQPQSTPQPQSAPQPLSPLGSVKPATTLRVYSSTISHGHAKLQATCTPAPCTLQTASWVQIGTKVYPGMVATTKLASPLLQHFYVTLPARTLRAIRTALEHRRTATLAVAVGTLDGTGAIADRDLVSLRVTKLAG
jgi:hypothetical protein